MEVLKVPGLIVAVVVVVVLVVLELVDGAHRHKREGGHQRVEQHAGEEGEARGEHLQVEHHRQRLLGDLAPGRRVVAVKVS